MRISSSFNAAFQTASNKICADLSETLKATEQISKVKVENMTQTGGLKAKVTFFFAEARVSAWLDRYGLNPGTDYPADIIFDGSHDTVASMIMAIRTKYAKFLSTFVDRVINEPLNDPSLNRKQLLLMRQTALIDAGFDAEAKLMANGDFRLVISHEFVRAPLREITVR